MTATLEGRLVTEVVALTGMDVVANEDDRAAISPVATKGATEVVVRNKDIEERTGGQIMKIAEETDQNVAATVNVVATMTVAITVTAVVVESLKVAMVDGRIVEAAEEILDIVSVTMGGRRCSLTLVNHISEGSLPHNAMSFSWIRDYVCSSFRRDNFRRSSPFFMVSRTT